MTAKFIIGDVFDGLASLEAGSVDLVVTSPPFLALRSYLPAGHPDKAKEIGSEPTPSEWLDTMLAVTKELRRVLAPHGSLCVELGDTYAGGNSEDKRGGEGNIVENWKPNQYGSATITRGGGADVEKNGDGWPLSKSKTLIPELYRIGLAYGINPLTGSESPAGKWRVRNTVTWCRPNPPVGALGDKWRPATSDLVIACTSGKRYWDDLATRQAYKRPDKIGGTMGYKTDYERPAEVGSDWINKPGMIRTDKGGAPLLDYWEIPPTGYSGSHYAVFPPALVEPLVKAMCPLRVCRVCGEPSRRIVSEATYEPSATYRGGSSFAESERLGENVNQWVGPNGARASVVKQQDTLGFTDCGHDSWRPGVILDPFAGSGTTGLVATGHGHDAILIDIDERNAELALDRVGPFLLEVVDPTTTPA